MTTTDLNLATFEDTQVHGTALRGRPPHMRQELWVVGPAGAVTCGFHLVGIFTCEWGRFDLISAYRRAPDGVGAYEISCHGLVYHWPRHRPLPAGLNAEDENACPEKEACEFLETHCRHVVGTSLGHDHLQDAMAREDKDYVFGYLKAEYERFFVTGYGEET